MSINIGGDILSSSGYTPNSEIVNPNVITDGLVVWYDAGNHGSYMDSDTKYYDCEKGFGCDYYSSPPSGCEECTRMMLDMSGHGNDSRFRGSAAVVPSEVGRSLFFNGTSGTYSATKEYFYDGENEITIMAWVNVKSYAGQGNIVANNFNNGYGFRVGTSGQLWFYVSGNSIQSSNGAVNTDEWVNLCVDGDASGLAAYINNVSVASNSTAYNPTGSGYLLLGTYNTSSEMFNGGMAIVLIYNRKLTEEERTQNYNATIQRFVTDEVLVPPTPSPSKTPSPSPTPSITPTITPSITPTRTPTPTPTRTPTPTPSPSDAGDSITLSWGATTSYGSGEYRLVTHAGHTSPQIITINFNYNIGYTTYPMSLYYSKNSTSSWTTIVTIPKSGSGSFSVTLVDYNDDIRIRWSTGGFYAGSSFSLNGGSVTSGSGTVSGTASWNF